MKNYEFIFVLNYRHNIGIKMLKKEIINEIQSLLRRRELSQRQIALKLGISRSAVRNVLKKMTESPTVRKIITPAGKPRRCPSCGGLVLMPCLACQIRALARTAKPERATIKKRGPKSPYD